MMQILKSVKKYSFAKLQNQKSQNISLTDPLRFDFSLNLNFDNSNLK